MPEDVKCSEENKLRRKRHLGIWGVLVWGTPLGGDMCANRTRTNPPSLSWAHSMKREHQQIQEPTLVVVCSRSCPEEPTFCSVGFPRRLAPTDSPSQAAGDQVFLAAPSLPKPLWVANAGSQAPYPLHLLLCHRHQSLTPSAFPFCPRHQASVPALSVAVPFNLPGSPDLRVGEEGTYCQNGNRIAQFKVM